MTKQKKVLPTRDLIFRKVFASPQNSHILIGFINDILDLDAKEVTVKDTYNIQSFYDVNQDVKMGYTQVDILAQLQDGSLVTIEMQVYKQLLFRERALFYAAETYVSNYNKHELEAIDKVYTKGELKYSSLRPIYSICIMVENEFMDDENPIHTFHLYDTEHNLPYRNIHNQDLVTMVFLELKKSSDAMKQNIKDWFLYFKTGEVTEEAPDYVKEACHVASYHNLRREEKAMIDAREKAEQDELARYYYIMYETEKKMLEAKEKAREAEEKAREAEKKGEQKGKSYFVQKMIAKGKTIQEIADFVELSEREIEELIK